MKNAEKKEGLLKSVMARSIVASVKLSTNGALLVVGETKNPKKTLFKANFSYSKDKLQKFDIYIPSIVAKELLKTRRPSKELIINLKGEKLKTLFYFHGGAFCSGDKKYYKPFCSTFAEQGFVVINVNYRLVPKIFVGDCYHDCIDAVNFCLEHFKFIDKRNVFFAGDSAGATIASYLAGKQLQFEIFGSDLKIAGLGLFYGVFNFSTVKNFFKFYLHSIYSIEYGNDKKLEELNQYHSPIYTVANGYPACFLASGDVDNLHNQSVEMVDKLKEYEITYNELFFKSQKDSIHGFLNLPKSKSKTQSIDECLKFFEECVTANMKNFIEKKIDKQLHDKKSEIIKPKKLLKPKEQTKSKVKKSVKKDLVSK